MKQFIGPLIVQPSVISAQYICQVPCMRSAFNLTMALLTADLVFLQAAWTLYTLVAGWWLRRKDPASDCCSGCLGMTANDPGQQSKIELLTHGQGAPGKPYGAAHQGEVETDQPRV